MAERFRLIYLKSAGAEKPQGDELPPISDSESSSSTALEARALLSSDTFSAQAMLQQAKADLKHVDAQVRRMAVRYLEKVDPAVSLPLLQEMVTDRDPEVRARALHSLVTLGDPLAGSWLRKGLKDRDSHVRIAALRGLFNTEEKVDLNLFLQFLSDESPWVRRKLATLLGWSHQEGVLPILAELTRDSEAQVRKAALFSLWSLYPEESEERLLEAMNDPDPDLRRWAMNTLETVARAPLGRA